MYSVASQTCRSAILQNHIIVQRKIYHAQFRTYAVKNKKKSVGIQNWVYTLLRMVQLKSFF